VSIDPSWYQLTESSPAIGKALALPDVQTDYFGTVRNSSPDMGAMTAQVGTSPDIGAHEILSFNGAFNKATPANGSTKKPSIPTLLWGVGGIISYNY